MLRHCPVLTVDTLPLLAVVVTTSEIAGGAALNVPREGFWAAAPLIHATDTESSRQTWKRQMPASAGPQG
jgi:hypothetical protein